MNNILNTLQTGIMMMVMMMVMIQYASYDKDSAIRFLAVLIGIEILKLLIKEWKDEDGY